MGYDSYSGWIRGIRVNSDALIKIRVKNKFLNGVFGRV